VVTWEQIASRAWVGPWEDAVGHSGAQGWQLCRGMGGSSRLESMAGLFLNTQIGGFKFSRQMRQPSLERLDLFHLVFFSS